MEDLVVVIGATGNVGRVLCGELAGRGVRVRAVARSAERLKGLSAAEVSAGSLKDDSFVNSVFSGAASAFIMVPPDYAAPDHRAYQRATAERLARALKENGVRRAVSLSSVGAELASGTGPIAGLHDLEECLNGVAGLSVVHLRPTYFMENHLSSIALIKGAGINGSSIRADLSLAMVATKDIAQAAAEYLRGRSFEGRSVHYLLGPRDYTPKEATSILGASVGRPDLAYLEFPYEETKKALESHGFSPSMASSFVEMQKGFNDGRIKPEERTTANTTGTTLQEFARDVFAPAFSA